MKNILLIITISCMFLSIAHSANLELLPFSPILVPASLDTVQYEQQKKSIAEVMREPMHPVRFLQACAVGAGIGVLGYLTYDGVKNSGLLYKRRK